MRVLLSIKPQFAELIFDGTKKFEFRKKIFKNKNIKTVVVYASSPIKKVIGEFEIKNIIYDDVENIWQITENLSGINKEYFFNYFSEREKGYAIEIKSVLKYKKPLSLEIDFHKKPPQSFLYLDNFQPR